MFNSTFVKTIKELAPVLLKIYFKFSIELIIYKLV